MPERDLAKPQATKLEFPHTPHVDTVDVDRTAASSFQLWDRLNYTVSSVSYRSKEK